MHTHTELSKILKDFKLSGIANNFNTLAKTAEKEKLPMSNNYQHL